MKLIKEESEESSTFEISLGHTCDKKKKKLFFLRVVCTAFWHQFQTKPGTLIRTRLVFIKKKGSYLRWTSRARNEKEQLGHSLSKEVFPRTFRCYLAGVCARNARIFSYLARGFSIICGCVCGWGTSFITSCISSLRDKCHIRSSWITVRDNCKQPASNFMSKQKHNACSVEWRSVLSIRRRISVLFGFSLMLVFIVNEEKRKLSTFIVSILSSVFVFSLYCVTVN